MGNNGMTTLPSYVSPGDITQRFISDLPDIVDMLKCMCNQDKVKSFIQLSSNARIHVYSCCLETAS